nr:iron donor protein CyaY [Brackiella oedipodis]
MTETEFLALTDDILNKIEDQAESWFEDLDIDIDTNRSGSVLTLVFNQKNEMVINSQAPFREIWVASPLGAHHYKQADNGQWLDTREDDINLAERLSTVCSHFAGRDLKVAI